MVIDHFSNGAFLKEAALGGAESNRAAINHTDTKIKKVLHPTKRPGQPSPKAEDNRLLSSKKAPKRGLCFCTINFVCINCKFNKQFSHYSHVSNFNGFRRILLLLPKEMATHQWAM